MTHIFLGYEPGQPMSNYYIICNNCDTGYCYCNEEFTDFIIHFPWTFEPLRNFIYPKALINRFTINNSEDREDFWFDTVEQFEIIPRKLPLVRTILHPLT
jgi:hypothetical protein